MKTLEAISEALAGAAIAVVTTLILFVSGLFAFGSMGKYVKNKSM